MSVPAKEQLVILVGTPGEVGLEEAPGVIVYGLGGRGAVIREPPTELQRAEPIKSFILHGTHWEVVLWEIRMWRWPASIEWRSTIGAYFDALIAGGAKVTWLGAEGISFVDPPHLFDPDEMEGAVLAWRTADGDEGWPLDPHKPFATATNDELRTLRRYAGGLADAE